MELGILWSKIFPWFSCIFEAFIHESLVAFGCWRCRYYQVVSGRGAGDFAIRSWCKKVKVCDLPPPNNTSWLLPVSCSSREREREMIFMSGLFSTVFFLTLVRMCLTHVSIFSSSRSRTLTRVVIIVLEWEPVWITMLDFRLAFCIDTVIYDPI